jgi:hypothetical protein
MDSQPASMGGLAPGTTNSLPVKTCSSHKHTDTLACTHTQTHTHIRTGTQTFTHYAHENDIPGGVMPSDHLAQL